MPTSRISARLLAGLSPGFSRGAMSAGMGGAVQQQGYADGAELQSKLAQALATTRVNSAKADQLEHQTAMQSPDALRGTAMLAAGVPLDAGYDVSEALTTGRLSPKFDALPEDIAGPALPKPDWAPKLGSIAQQIAATQSALALGDSNSANIGKNIDAARERSLGDAMIAGTTDPTRVAVSQYALKGSAPFSFNEYGVGNQLTGKVDASGAPAQTFAERRRSEIAENQAQAGSARASAANSYASADQHRATTDRIRATPVATPAGHGKAPTGYRYVQGDDGDVRLEPIPGGPKDTSNAAGKPLPTSAAKGYLENVDSLRQVQNALQLIRGQDVGDLKGDANATGFKGYLPNAILARTDPQGIAVRAAVADIGSLKLHDRSGASVTASETPRLAPFIPSATDHPDTVVKKLTQFEHNYRALVEDTEEFYRSSGFNVPTIQSRKPQQQPAAAAPNRGAPAGNGFTYLGKE